MLRGRPGQPYDHHDCDDNDDVIGMIITMFIIRLTAIREALRQPKVQREITVKTAAGKEFK